MKKMMTMLTVAGSMMIATNANAASFNSNNPLPATADGTHYLFLDDLGGTETNRFVAVNTGVVMSNGSTYDLIGAIGDALGESLRTQSIQMWRSNDGSVANRSFLGQQFTTSGTWNSPADGGWADNNVSYTAGAGDDGLEIIILLTNYDVGPGLAYWDNFRIEEDSVQVYQESFEIGLSPGTEGEVADAGWDIGNATIDGSGIARPIPEPASLALLAVGGALLLRRKRA